MNRSYRALWAVFVLATAMVARASEPRIALVIGNSQYASGALANPGNDAKLIGDALSKLGFEVVLRRDADQTTMKRAIEEFGTRLGKAGANAVGLFYYAGHGVQLNGRNYLIPTTARIEHEGDMDIEAVSADWVLEQMQYAQNRVNIVILDACRNNPFKRSMRSLDRGLAVMDAPTGTVVAYSTAPGQVAADGDGRDSPYSSALANAILQSQDPVEQVFKHVRVAVLDATGGKQTPWEASSLTGDFYFDKSAAKGSLDESKLVPLSAAANSPNTPPTTAAPAAAPPVAASPVASSSVPSGAASAMSSIASSASTAIFSKFAQNLASALTPAASASTPSQFPPAATRTSPPAVAVVPGAGVSNRSIPMVRDDVCGHIVGRWREAGVSGEIEVEANHSLAWRRNQADSRPVAIGTWSCQSAQNRRFVFTWSQGGVDSLTLSADDHVLAGSNQRGLRVVNTRVSTIAQLPRWIPLTGGAG